MTDLTQNRAEGGAEGVEDARAALGRWHWAEALELARSIGVLDGRAEADRLDIVAEASWWLGDLDDCIEAREQAYMRYEALGENVEAGRCAVRLYEHHVMKTRSAMAGAWLRRGRRALDAETETIEFGGLILREAEVAHGSGDLDGATALARDALALARRLSSADLEAEALQTIGRLLIDAGQFADGLGHLDEAMLTAVEGGLSPYTSGKVHCSMISACEALGDLRRAAEWTDATLRWSESHPLAMWPGICRVHHAALLQLHGDWPAAEREARRACIELDGFHVPNVAAGYVEIGEIRRRLGDLQGAEEAFAKADELCGLHSAGLALVRLAQRRIDAANTIIARLLAEQTWSRLARARLLPARVQIAVAAGELDDATEAVVELEQHRRRLREPGPDRGRALGAWAAAARRGQGERRLRHPAAGPPAMAAARGALRGRDRGAAPRPGMPQRRRRGCRPSFVRSGGGDIRPARRRPRLPAHPRPHLALARCRPGSAHERRRS